ncbi:MAG TPA: ring-cleaving dioxygenase [Chloroflexota bacterium]
MTDSRLELGGLHHLTAVTGNPPANVAFYTDVLGLRLVKKTVNQDDVSAYHLFYGDEVGRAGTEVTFFDWSHLAPTARGSGAVTATALQVPDRAALDWWAAHLAEHGVAHSPAERAGRAALAFEDPEGQRLELVDASGGSLGGRPWSGSPVPPEVAVRGLHAVALTVRQLEGTAWLLTEVLGFRQREVAADGTVIFETGPGGPGAEVRVLVQPDLPPEQLGTGGVHHVAFRAPDDETHARWRWHLARQGVGVTPVIDRYYFKSIYFREPGGVLFEIATDGPGFATDEDPAHLGEHLSLPPFLEPRRAAIEAGLRPIRAAMSF